VTGRRVAAGSFAVRSLGWLLLGSLASALGCPGRPSEVPRARGEIATILVLPERGAAAIVADASFVFVATWHGVVRASHAGASVIALYDAPMGGVSPTLLAADATRVYLVETRPCEGDAAGFAGGHRLECPRIVAVPKDGAPPAIVVDLPPGPAPRGLAADGGYVYFTDKRRVLRAPIGGGAAAVVALAEEDVQDVGVEKGRVVWVEADLDAAPPDGRLVTRDDRGARRVVGQADPGRAPLVLVDGRVHWVGAEKVWRASVRGGAAESLGEARAKVGEARLAADAAGVAWTEDEARVALRPASGVVSRALLDGERPTSVALAGPFAFVATVHTDGGSTRLLRITR
jgi:hypothetical protein